MKVFLSGGEKGSHRSLLLSCSVPSIAINLTHLAIPKRKELQLAAMFNGAALALYTSEGDEDKNRYESFLRNHSDELSVVIGRPDYDGEWLGEKYIPIWSDDQDLERLAWICQKTGRVAISDKAINGKTLSRIRSLSQRWGAKLVGITSKPDVIEALPWDMVIVSSWTSAIRYGETQVWDGHGLRRYPAQQKESARRKHRSDIIRLGIDIDAVMEDDVTAVGKLAIKSWQQWESKNMAYDPLDTDDEGEFSSSNSSDIANISTQPSTPSFLDSGGTSIAMSPVQKRHGSERVLIPVMGIDKVASLGSKTHTDQGESIELAPEEVPVVRYQSDPIRQCDSCYIASRCPAFKEHSECGFSIPLEIKTKDQLQAALRALLEMQMSRVLFARLAEELEGQGLDPALSKEVDRMFDLVNKFKDISDSRELVRLEIETRQSGGVLSRLFGPKAGETAKQLSHPLSSDNFDQLALDIIDVDDE